MVYVPYSSTVYVPNWGNTVCLLLTYLTRPCVCFCMHGWQARHHLWNIQWKIHFIGPGPIFTYDILEYVFNVSCWEIIHVEAVGISKAEMWKSQFDAYNVLSYISPRNIFIALWAIECRHPETINPVSSKFFIVLEEAFAAFQRLLPHIPETYVDCTHCFSTVLSF